MTVVGTVQHGVVVLPAGVSLPEGTPVHVIPVAVKVAEETEAGSIWDMSDLAVETGIPDLATNIDHYLYGHPKVVDEP